MGRCTSARGSRRAVDTLAELAGSVLAHHAPGRTAQRPRLGQYRIRCRLRRVSLPSLCSRIGARLRLRVRSHSITRSRILTTGTVGCPVVPPTKAQESGGLRLDPHRVRDRIRNRAAILGGVDHGDTRERVSFCVIARPSFERAVLVQQLPGSPRQRVRAGGGDQPLRHPVVHVDEPSRRPSASSTTSKKERR